MWDNQKDCIMKNEISTSASRAGFWRKLAFLVPIALLTVFLVKPALFQYYELIYVAELIP